MFDVPGTYDVRPHGSSSRLKATSVPSSLDGTTRRSAISRFSCAHGRYTAGYIQTTLNTFSLSSSGSRAEGEQRAARRRGFIRVDGGRCPPFTWWRQEPRCVSEHSSLYRPSDKRASSTAPKSPLLLLESPLHNAGPLVLETHPALTTHRRACARLPPSTGQSFERGHRTALVAVQSDRELLPDTLTARRSPLHV